MRNVVADLHLHSKYSRAVSPQMTLPLMAQVGAQKGIDILATGDWTHPLWFAELKDSLEEAEEGLYTMKSQGPLIHGQQNTRFLLSVEISCIYSQGGKGRRIHNLVFVPSFEVAEKVNQALIKRGCTLTADGRPVVGLSSKHLLELLLGIDARCLLIPAHVWTPWFGIYGMQSGFNSLKECFEDLSAYVYGIETGLSSDPEMNWQVEELSTRSILSFSDAHSAAKMGREATVFALESLSYENIRQAIMEPSKGHAISDDVPDEERRDFNKQESTLLPKTSRNDIKNRVLYTVEFYPEEGKYHYSGHRKCGVILNPSEQRQTNGICPVCGRHVTDGVMRRVQELSQEDPRASTTQNSLKIKWYVDPQKKHPPFVKMVPLNEIIAEAIGSPVTSPKVKVIFDGLTRDVSCELDLLLKVPLPDIERALMHLTPRNAAKVVEGIQRIREGQVDIHPGYDGVYGVVHIWKESPSVTQDSETSQLGLEI